MLRKILIGVAAPLVLILALILGACGSSAPAVKPTWITPGVSGDNVSIPLAAVQQDTIVHFWVTTTDGRESFMAYQYGGATYVRADVCVPCRSTEFSLQGNTLVCDSCGTKFNATTGKGVSGACVAYAKVAAKYELVSGNIIVQLNDLGTAYSNTVNRIG